MVSDKPLSGLGLKAWKVRVPSYRDVIITAAKSRDSARMQTMEALRWDDSRPTWIEIQVLRAPEYDHLAATVRKEHTAIGEINQDTKAVTIYHWIERSR